MTTRTFDALTDPLTEAGRSSASAARGDGLPLIPDESAGEPPKKPSPPEFTSEERNAMRAFLQRSEVRLSTMHRVAVGFLSGAGLLFLFPVFLKDGVLTVVSALLEYVPVLPPGPGVAQIVGTVALYLAVIFPFVLSLSLPAVALILLLEDIVRFYFVGHPPSFPQELFNPRFALTGVAFSPDESEKAKARILRYEYGTDLINFVISHADAQSRYYSDIIDKPKRMIVPATRKLPKLVKGGVVQLATGRTVEQLGDDEVVRVQGTYTNGNGEEALLETPYVERTVKEIDRFNAALGLAGFIDRSLYQEVAKTEVSLVRHGLKLRRLVLRYFQALLILIWTALITFLMQPFLLDGRLRLFLVFAVTYFIWALLAPMIVQLPLTWLVSNTRNDVRQEAVKHFEQQDALQSFGRLTRRLCYGALAASVVAFVLEMALRV